jgi:hypothetical protein
MALHRDIFWVGKQWAVTGYGMQAVDQKQKSKFDIEASRLWEDDLLDDLTEQRWFNVDDFNAGLTVARARYPEAPGKAASRKKAKESARVPVAPSKAAPKVESKVESSVAAKAELKAEPPKADAKAGLAKPLPTAEPATAASKVGSGITAAKPQSAKSEAAPAPAKLAFTGGSTTSTISVRAGSRKRAAAQFNLPIGRWPAKFTRMWRVRVNPQ